MASKLKAPFPYNGGKSRWADLVIEAMGTIDVYAEPFAGSIAVLLASPKRKREVVCDLDGFISNFWRAVRADPDAVAYWAEWPTVHQDLTARHRWLWAWGQEERNTQRLSEDPDFYDAKVAGWWAWGKSNWIGPQFPRGTYTQAMPSTSGGPSGPGRGVQSGRSEVHDKIPAASGQGVQGHRDPADGVHDIIPTMGGIGGGQGLQSHRDTPPGYANVGTDIPVSSSAQGVQGHRSTRPLADGVHDIIPQQSSRGVQSQRSERPQAPNDSLPYAGGAQGVNAVRTGDRPGFFAPQQEGYEILAGERWRPWMRALADRLERVVVLNRSWESAVTPAVLGYSPNSAKMPRIGVFLDPPYTSSTEGQRRSEVYANEHQADVAAHAAQEWAVANGDRYRIIYAGYPDQHVFPDTWRREERKLPTAKRDEDGVRRPEALWISPSCVAAYEEQVDGLLRF